jgi:glycine C-acetyltransferase
VEATLRLQSGFTAHLTVIPALVQAGDVLFSDARNHASMIAGCRRSGAQIVRSRHGDTAALAAALQRTAGVRRRLVIPEGVLSMDGDLAPVPELVQVAAPDNALVMVDDAHGEGGRGRGGRGSADPFGRRGQVDIAIGTLSKAFGVIGGYVAGPQVLVESLKQRGRPYLFSSASTAAAVAACIAAVEIRQQSDHAVQQRWENTRLFQAALRAVGFDLGRTQTPITPVMVGDAQRAKTFSAELFTAGIFAQAVAFPTVPRLHGAPASDAVRHAHPSGFRGCGADAGTGRAGLSGDCLGGHPRHRERDASGEVIYTSARSGDSDPVSATSASERKPGRFHTLPGKQSSPMTTCLLGRHHHEASR